MSKIGSIPEKLIYVYSKSTCIDGELVYPTFIADANKPKTIETGTNWAEIKEWDKNNSGISVSKLEVNNSPVSKIRISSLEKRGRGGRAYKVIITLPNKSELFYVDLREDVLMDTILEKGIDEKGILKGEFIWARVDTDMKLIRVGSKLHEEMIQSTKLNSVKISKSKLEIGGVYSNKHHTKVYLGEFTTVNCVQRTIETIKNISSYSWRKEYDISYEYSFEIVKKTQLWCENDYSNSTTGFYHSVSSIIGSCKLIINLSDLIEHQNYAFCFDQVSNRTIKSKDSQLIVDCNIIESVNKLGNNLINSKPIQQYYSNCPLVHLTELGKPIQVNEHFKQFPELISKVKEYNSQLKVK
jgi:hypothetical protein